MGSVSDLLRSMASSYNTAPYVAAPGAASNMANEPRVSGQTFNTQLDPLQEMMFRQWVGTNKVPFNPDAPASDYDMRGFYRGLQQGDPRAMSAVDPNDNRLHYPDNWKTPSHETFSAQSQWAKPGAPDWNQQDQLVSPGGRVLFDDRKPR